MSKEVIAPMPTEAGTVKEIKVRVNDKVATNQVLMVLE